MDPFQSPFARLSSLQTTRSKQELGFMPHGKEHTKMVLSGCEHPFKPPAQASLMKTTKYRKCGKMIRNITGLEKPTDYTTPS